MTRVPFGWHSPAVGRTLNGLRFGDAGRAVVLFPTAGGDEGECERFGLVGALAPLIDAGRVRLYCVSSISGEGWLSEGASAREKATLQAAFDRYVSLELVPMIRHELGDPLARVITAGASLGAYNAVNALAKHPDQVWLAIGMSGTYDFDRFVGGERNDDYYFNQPLLFLPNLADPVALEWLRRSFFLLATGQGRWEAPWETTRLAEILSNKAIPHQAEYWGYDIDHDWPTWRTMLPLFLDRMA